MCGIVDITDIAFIHSTCGAGLECVSTFCDTQSVLAVCAVPADVGAACPTECGLGSGLLADGCVEGLSCDAATLQCAP